MDSAVVLLLLGSVIGVWGVRNSADRIPGAPRRFRSANAVVVGSVLILVGIWQSFHALLPAGNIGVVYRSAKHNYSVTFPAAPQTTEKSRDVDGQILDEETTMAKSSDGGMMFEVIVTDVPPGSPGPEAMENTRNAILAHTRNPIDLGSLLLGDTRGCELTYGEHGDKVRNRIRMFAVGGRLYKVMVVGTDDRIMSDEAARFLDSFVLTRLDRMPTDATRPAKPAASARRRPSRSVNMRRRARLREITSGSD